MSDRTSVEWKNGTWRAVLVLAFLLSLSSAGLVQKYLGLAGVAANLLVATVVLGLLARYGRGVGAFLDNRFVGWVALAVILLAVGYGVGHPYEDGRGLGRSSDRDEGLEIAVARLISGETPYYPANPVAGPLSVLPGGISLSVPFVLLGDVGFQNVFWIGVFLVAGAAWFGQGSLASGLALAMMVLSPSFLHEFASGGDLIANGMYVAILMVWCFLEWNARMRVVGERDAGLHKTNRRDIRISGGGRWAWPSTVLLGIAMASRPNFLLLYPLFACGLWRVAGLRTAVISGGGASLVSLCMILPFYMNDPAGFTPWIARRKVAIADQALPWAGTAIIGLTALLALAGAMALLRGRGESGKTLADLCRWCAAVTLSPMICAVIARSWILGALDFGFMLDRFGVMYLGFAAFGWGGALMDGGGREDACLSRR